MGLLEKVERGDFAKSKKKPIWSPQESREIAQEKSLPHNLVPATPPEERIKVRIGLNSGKLALAESEKKTTRPSTSVRLARAPSGIAALDREIEDGFIKGSVNLIGGGPGCGKSIFCMQFLVRGIEQFKESGIFVSFEQPEEKILEDMGRFGWKLDQKIRDRRLAVMYFTPEQVEKILESGSGNLKDMIDFIGAKRIVIDSLNAFALLYNDEVQKRKAIIRLFDLIHRWDITTLATLERESDEERHEASQLEFETDSVVLFYNRRGKNNQRSRSLEIYKMRGTKHTTKPLPLFINDKGITVGKETS